MEFVGELAIALASLSYACGAVYARHAITGHPIIVDPVRGPRAPTPVEIALPQVVVAAPRVVLAIITEIGQPAPVLAPPSLSAWFAVLWLGLLGSCVAYLLLFRIIRAGGDGGPRLVTTMPIVGIALGVARPLESLHPAEIAGTVLIIAACCWRTASTASGGSTAVPRPASAQQNSTGTLPSMTSDGIAGGSTRARVGSPSEVVAAVLRPPAHAPPGCSRRTRHASTPAS